MDERLKKQINFILEADKVKQITRQTYLADGSRKENDAEHSFHLALMAYLLADYSNEPINRERTMMMCLVHDLVEIDAGDTYAFDKEHNKTKRERELRAADRIFGLLPEDQAKELRALWDEFEAKETPEARFANVLDHLQPELLTDNANGKSWKEHGVAASWLEERNSDNALGSQPLAKLVEDIVAKNIQNGNLIDK